MIQVIRSGPLTTVQDLGRTGWAHLGVPRSGALDLPALRWANRLVGNPDAAAGLEITLGGFRAWLTRPATIALTGAFADLLVTGTAMPWGVSVRVPAGGQVDIRRVRQGLRCYLAVDGGIAVPPVLGSRSTDTLSGLGPAVVRAGDALPLGSPATPGRSVPPDSSPPDSSPPDRWAPDSSAPPDDGIVLRVCLGPRHDWFTAEAIEVLLRTAYTISPDSNRIGARLAGPTLTRAVLGELPSEGIVLGAMQVPADGQPLIFLADHPTTGGYPVVAIVEPADLPLVAQARPGTSVRFRGPQR